jgi:GTP-binding protein HflX
MEFYNTTMKVLADLGADTKEMLVVFNKMDRVADDSTRTVLRRHFPDAVFISVHSGDGLDALVERIGEFVSKNTGHVELRLPPERADLLARLHREGAVHAVEYEEDAIRVRATLPDRLSESLAEFLAPMKSAPRTPTGAAV